MAQAHFPNIQGMRALAVLSVAAFHAFPALLPGGFIGVDVFFVISGYLISGILLRDLAAGSFRLGDFYARRIRRIFPALLVVLAACLGFGYLALLPEELAQLGTHTAGGAGFLANVMLWREAGYFDHSAATKPLLHLWSLGVEEQFYIVWPLLLFSLWQQRRYLLPALLLLAGGSFAYNLATMHSNPVAAFYSPLSRFWELAVGGLLAYWHLPAGEQTQGGIRRHFNGRAAAGLTAVLAAACLLTQDLPFPGYWALLPVGGAALLIAAGPRAMFNRSLLSHPVMVWLGGISYPFYLWHWPLLSYAYILQSGQPGAALRVAALGAALLLAWLTQAMVEKPLRCAPSRLVPYGLAACLALVGLTGFHLYRADGLPQRTITDFAQYLPVQAASAAVTEPHATPEAVVDQPAVPPAAIEDTAQAESAVRRFQASHKNNIGRFYDSWLKKNALQRYGSCHIYEALNEKVMTFKDYLAGNAACVRLAGDRKNILVFGDSAAAEVYLALARAYPEFNFVQVTGSACKPFRAAYRDEEHRCAQLLEYAYALAQQQPFDGIVIASQWQDDYRAAQPDLERFARLGKPLLLVGPPLVFSEEVVQAMLRMSPSDTLAAKLDPMISRDNLKIAGDMAGFAARQHLRYIDRVALYCEQGCPIITPDGEPMVFDKFHLSVPGIDLLGSRLKARRALETLLEKS